MRWGEFRIGDLFDSIQQGSRLKKLDQIAGELPFIMAGTTNTGLVKYIGNKNVRCFPKNSITVDIFGNAFYRSYEYGAGDDTGAYWNEKNELSKEVMLYYCTAIEVALRGKFSYGKKLRSSQSHNIVISLPVNPDGSLDFAYMEAFIFHVESEHLRDLETKRDLHLKTYLAVAELADYKLIDDYRKILAIEPQWGEFRVGDLFDTIKRGKRIKSLDRIDGELPFITAGTSEQGLSGYIGNPEAECFPPNSLTIDMFGTVFYRSYRYGADDHVAVLYNKSVNYSREALLYMGVCIEKSIAGMFSYSRNFYASDAYDIIFPLPETKDGTPDFKYMEAYIKEQFTQKITDTINNLNLEINATLHIIKNKNIL